MIKLRFLLIPLNVLMLLACAETNGRYKDNADLERPPKIAVDKQAQANEEDVANQADNQPPKHQGKGLKSDVEWIEGSPPLINIKRNFDESWDLLHQVLLDRELKVTDSDRSKGNYEVEYGESGLFGLSSLFGDAGNHSRYRISAKEHDGATQVAASLVNKDSKADSSKLEEGDSDNGSKDRSAELMEHLYDSLRDDVKQ